MRNIPAFPTRRTGHAGDDEGMSLRDWFAGLAMQGLYADGEGGHDPESAEAVAKASYMIADAMLKERDQ